MRCSISITSSRLTFSVCAMESICSSLSVSRWVATSRSSLKPCFMERRLKNNLRCALVVAIFTMRQFFKMYSWISALIQCKA